MLQLRTAKQSSVTTARCQAKKSSDVAVLPLHESAQGICRRTLFNIVSLSLPLLWPRKAGALEVGNHACSSLLTAYAGVRLACFSDQALSRVEFQTLGS